MTITTSSSSSATVDRVHGAAVPDEIALDRLAGLLPAEAIIAETGGDKTAFQSAKHLVSWAGLPRQLPISRQTPLGRTTKGSKWLRAALTESAKAGART